MVDASILDTKLKNLMWITPEYSNDPLKELNLLKKRYNDGYYYYGYSRHAHKSHLTM